MNHVFNKDKLLLFVFYLNETTFSFQLLYSMKNITY